MVNITDFDIFLNRINGGELFERVIDEDFVLTERLCQIYMHQICQGVEFMHNSNILHLDMKVVIFSQMISLKNLFLYSIIYY